VAIGAAAALARSSRSACADGDARRAQRRRGRGTRRRARGARRRRGPRRGGGDGPRAPGQRSLAVTTLALLRVAPALLPAALGAGFGALLYLVLAELLPASYLPAGRTSIALVVILAAGIVALLGGGALAVPPAGA
jgi:hypothetical protein